MSDRDDSNSRARRPPEASLDALALAELLAALRAAGDEPRLSALIAALPQQATGSLADAMMSVMLDVELDVEEAESAEDEEGEEGEEGAEPGIFSLGTQRGVDAVFGVDVLATLEVSRIPDSRDDRDDMRKLVAETPTVYRLSTSAPSNMEEGLLALARKQGFDAGTLGEQIMLSPPVIGWLDRVALLRDQQPEAMVSHLAGALGVDRERVEAALAQGESVVDASTLIGMLSATNYLTPVQRGYWLALLTSSD